MVTNQSQNTAKTGQLVCIDCGEYSDYSVLGIFVVLKDFDPLHVLEEFLTSRPEQRKPYCFEQFEFLATLLEKKLLRELEYGTLYLGNYSDYNQLEFTQPCKSYGEG